MQPHSEQDNPQLGQELLGFRVVCWGWLQLYSEHQNPHLGQELLEIRVVCWGFVQVRIHS